MGEFVENIDGIAFIDPDTTQQEHKAYYPEGFDIDPPSVVAGIEWTGGQKVRWEVFRPYGEEDGIWNN